MMVFWVGFIIPVFLLRMIAGQEDEEKSEGVELRKNIEAKENEKPNKPETSVSVKRKRKSYNNPIGYQTNERRTSRKIVKLLAEKGNGINNYKDARLKAEEYMLQRRKHVNQGLRERREKQRLQGIVKPKKVYKAPPGYKSTKNKLDRRTKTFLKNNPGINEQKARDMAVEEYEYQKAVAREYKRKKKAEKEVVKP